MDLDTRRVLKGFYSLSPSQRVEFLNAVIEFQQAAEYKKIELSNRNKGILEVTLGPRGSSVCKCCGS